MLPSLAPPRAVLPGVLPGVLRVEVAPGEDVLLPRDREIGTLRDALARTLWRPELADAPLYVDDRALPDTHLVGVPPLTPGATVATTPRAPGPDVALLRAERHLAVVAGHDAGTLRALGRRDVAFGLRLRTRRRRVVVRGPRTARWAGGRRTWWTGAPRTWADGRRVEVDGQVVELRGRLGATDAATARAHEAAEPAPSAARPSGTAVTAALAPLGGAVALALASGHLWLLALGALGPLSLVASVRGPRRAPGAAHVLADPSLAATHAVLVRAGAPSDAGPADPPHRGPAPGPGRPRGADEDACVAVVGPAQGAAALARSLVLAHLVRGGAVRVQHPDDAASDWAWLRWLPTARRVDLRDGGVPPGALLVVDSRGGPAHDAATARWWAHRPGGARLLVLVREPAHVPAWCTTTVTVRPGRGPHALAGGHVVWTRPDEPAHREPVAGTGIAAAEHVARRLAARQAPPGDALPTGVALAGLLGLDTAADARALAEQVAAAWRLSPTGLAVPLGVGPSGEVVVDLVADGPHALVAGTTGSGKSELLQSLVLGLALTRPPDDLAVALVDFKGGASFGRCADLPHVVGQVTDLDAVAAARALAGLRTELRRRERALAAAGLTRLDGPVDTPAGRLPRLLVVVDEFRALADDLPELLPGLLRVAAQGRSLGVHLVLATQRPAGAVSADVRANVSLRVALRTADPADSFDTIGVPDAASLERVPGRGVLRRGSAPPEPFQAAHAATGTERATVRRASPWGSLDADGSSGRPASARPTPAAGGPADRPADIPADRPADAADRPADGPADAEDPADRLVQACVAAADGHRRQRAPWAPPLPHPLEASSVPLDGAASAPATDEAPGGSRDVALGLLDLPDEQRHGLATWRFDDGPLVVVGRARSGRTTSLRRVVAAHAARDGVAHVLADDVAPWADLAAHVGTLVGPDEPSLAVRVLRHVLDAPDDTLVVVDGIERWRSALATGPTGAEPEPFEALLGRRAGVAVGASSARGLAPGALLVLGTGDRHEDVLLGVPPALAGARALPGRGVLVSAAGAAACQVALPPHLGRTVRPPATGDRTARLARLPAPGTPATAMRTPRVRPGASAVEPPGAPGGAPGDLVLAVAARGDRLAEVSVDLARGLLVLGPPGSGRSSALAVLVRVLAGTLARAPGNRRLRVVTTDERLAVLAREHGAPVASARSDATAQEVAAWLTRSDAAGPEVVVVDDADELPSDVRLLLDAAHDRPDGPVLVVAAGPGSLHRPTGTLAAACGDRPVLVLGEAVARRTLGVDTRWTLDPAPPPGRGVLVTGHRADVVQVLDPWTDRVSADLVSADRVSADAVVRDDAGRGTDDGRRHEEHEDREGQRHDHEGERCVRLLEGGERPEPLQELPGRDG